MQPAQIETKNKPEVSNKSKRAHRTKAVEHLEQHSPKSFVSRPPVLVLLRVYSSIPGSFLHPLWRRNAFGFKRG